MEKQRDKAAKRLQRKADKAAGIRPADESEEPLDAVGSEADSSSASDSPEN